jgi:ketosteroid isomerase-like protein
LSIEDNKQAALRFFQHLHSGEVGEAFALMAPDALLSVTSDVPGGASFTAEDMRRGAEAAFRAFVQRPVTRTTVIAAEDDRVCIEVESRGGRTHGGTTYDNDYFIWLRLRGGLIVEFREYFKPILAAPLMAELNAIAS